MKVGIAGAGFMARTHASAYDGMNVEVVAVASPSGPEPFLEEAGLEADAYTDPKELCERADIDFLDVCTPTDTHRALVEIAAETGTDVFLEKPIAPTLEAAREIESLVDEADLTCEVGHVVRFDPAYRRARDCEIGTPGVARARRLSPFPDWGTDDWFADDERSGGLFVDLAIHDLDYLRWCWGPVDRVFARRTRDERAAHGTVTLRFANGAVGYVEASWAQPDSRPFATELELAGDDGLVEHESADPRAYRAWTAEDAIRDPASAKTPYRRELEQFVAALETGGEPAVGPAEATDSLRLALAAERSAERGTPVSPAEVEG
jgi:UDP-N-acetylglucosamine 3-dehydrogenase